MTNVWRIYVLGISEASANLFRYVSFKYEALVPHNLSRSKSFCFLHILSIIHQSSYIGSYSLLLDIDKQLLSREPNSPKSSRAFKVFFPPLYFCSFFHLYYQCENAWYLWLRFMFIATLIPQSNNHLLGRSLYSII